MTQSAVLYQIQIMGEAAGKVSAEFRNRHPEIARRDIVGMRNFIVHQYFDVSVDLVWEVVQTHVPGLIAELESLVPIDARQ